MSLLGIDVGTTGCKAVAFSHDGAILGKAYREYDILHRQPGYAELDSERVWLDVKDAISEAVAEAAHKNDPVTALCVSSLGEAVVPVTRDRRILGHSLLCLDRRGEAYLEALAQRIDNEHLYRVNGNTLGNHYTLTKLLWTRDQEPDQYAAADLFLHWGPFIAFMLGAEPFVDYCLANRTLLFDVDKQDWSADLAERAGIDLAKLPRTVAPGTVVGRVAAPMADELGLSHETVIVSGAHDQCANAVGSGAIQEGSGLFSMGTFFCITPVFTHRPDARAMIAQGLCTEHHAVPGRFATFLYNEGGSLLKWYRDTFAADAHRTARENGIDIYPELLREMPEGPSPVLVLPHFSPTGPPEFVADSCGVMVGLHIETKRGDILKALLEAGAFYLRVCLDGLPQAGIALRELRVVGGGSHSNTWLQICADIFGRPITRARVPEAGALGGAILAGVATGVFASAEEGANAMVQLGQTFDPEPAMQRRYDERFAQYRQLWPLMKDYLRKV